jgi:hypothetical protein
MSVMAGTALMMAKTSLSSKGPSLGLWCDCNFPYIKDSSKKLLCTAESWAHKKIPKITHHCIASHLRVEHTKTSHHGSSLHCIAWAAEDCAHKDFPPWHLISLHCTSKRSSMTPSTYLMHVPKRGMP